jgi:hypothetical protein
VRGRGRGWEIKEGIGRKGGVKTQTFYAHMNKRKKRKEVALKTCLLNGSLFSK